MIIKKAYADTKTITVDPDDGSVMIQQTDISQIEGVEVSGSGFKLNTGLGWGVDVAVVLVVIALIYVGKKFVDRYFDKRHNDGRMKYPKPYRKKK